MPFMAMMPWFAATLYQCDHLTIQGTYNRCFIKCHKQHVERIGLSLKKGLKYATKQVSIFTIDPDPQGCALTSKSKL